MTPTTDFDFKPGDVALLTFDDGSTAVGVHREAGAWAHGGGFGNGSAYDYIGGFTAHPLVVIDAEDREQVERLDALIDAGLSGKDSPKWAGPADILQAALREFANPTPPPLAQPTDLSARVLDRDGDEWALVARVWCRPNRSWRTWATLQAEFGPLRLAGDDS